MTLLIKCGNRAASTSLYSFASEKAADGEKGYPHRIDTFEHIQYGANHSHEVRCSVNQIKPGARLTARGEPPRYPPSPTLRRLGRLVGLIFDHRIEWIWIAPGTITMRLQHRTCSENGTPSRRSKGPEEMILFRQNLPWVAAVRTRSLHAAGLPGHMCSLGCLGGRAPVYWLVLGMTRVAAASSPGHGSSAAAHVRRDNPENCRPCPLLRAARGERRHGRFAKENYS